MLTNKGYRNIIKSIEIVNVRFESETPDTRYLYVSQNTFLYFLKLGNETAL